MSAIITRNRILKLLAIACIGVMMTGCSSKIPDENKKRSQQQEKELRDRIMTTQVDR